MKHSNMHPADEIVRIMDRIYQIGMTTTSGGNLSIRDKNGDILITPSGIDKGALTRDDICRVASDGTASGPHQPSVELPFHAAIYNRRHDLRAVLHAHSPALTAFAIAGILPDTRLTVGAYSTVGQIAMTPYAPPGSKPLCDGIAAQFENGFDAVLLQNHGIVIGAKSLAQAFMKFETLELSAQTQIHACKLGKVRSLSDSQLRLAADDSHTDMVDFAPCAANPEELTIRRDMITLIRRAYGQRLFSGAQGAYSARLSDGSFIITPHGIDRADIEERDLVLVKNGKKEEGKIPSCSVTLHRLIYENSPDICSVTGAAPVHAMAFAVTDAQFDPRVLPESHAILRDIRKAPFAFAPSEVARMLCAETPVLLLENNQMLAAGNSLLQAFDRLEVAEAAARSIINAVEIGRTEEI